MKAADLVIEQLAADLAAAEEDGARYRMLAMAAVENVHELTVENKRLRAQLEHLREEVRTLVTAERQMTTARRGRAA